MAVVKACSIKDAIKNLGVSCNRQIGAAAMIAALPPDLKATAANLADIAWWRTKMHAPEGERVYLLFGNKAPIHMQDNAEENDAMVTMDNGATFFVRYGFYNTTYSTGNGSLCYAQALASLVDSGYSLVEIDKRGQAIFFDNKDNPQTYSGLPAQFMYSPKPQKANQSDAVYMNKFYTSVDPQIMLDNGVLLSGLNFLLNINGGLIDAKLVAADASTTTLLKIKVLVDCTEENLVAKLTTKWNFPANFIVRNVDALSTPVTITAVANLAMTDGELGLTLAGTFVSGDTYRVYPATAAAWLANEIIGYEGIDYVDIDIP